MNMERMINPDFIIVSKSYNVKVSRSDPQTWIFLGSATVIAVAQ